jgi:hypothetical protein
MEKYIRIKLQELRHEFNSTFLKADDIIREHSPHKDLIGNRTLADLIELSKKIEDLERVLKLLCST